MSEPAAANASPDDESAAPPGLLARVPLWAVTGFAWTLVATALLAAFWQSVASRLASPDDAMRLVQVRDFLSGGSWFYPIEPRMGLDGNYLSHWSRLIDAPIALLIRLFGEQAALTIWPLLMLLAIMGASVAIAARLGGRSAGLIAALFGALCLAGFAQLRPGVIHHHNAQMAASLIFFALTLAAPASRRAALAAGAFFALSLALGLESLPVLAVGLAGLALRFIVAPETVRTLIPLGFSIALSSLLIYGATVPPARWLVTECDALAFNMLGLAVIGGLGLVMTGWIAPASLWRRAALLSVTGACAVGFFIASDRSCMAGPYGHFDPALWPVWIDYVSEMFSLQHFASIEPAGAAFYFAFPAIGVAATMLLLRQNRSADALIVVAVFIVCVIVAALHVRGAFYANWYAVPIVAAACARALRSPLVTALTLALLNPTTVTTIAIAAAPAAGTADAIQRDAGRCFDSSAYRALAALPPGLVLAQLDLAPYVLALTPHRVVMGPYHRLDRDLLMARRLVAGPPEAAEALLRAAGVAYVVDCKELTDRFADTPGSFRSALTADNAPPYLVRIAAPDSPLMMWRLSP
jgi:hypothetical protein